jgi:acyl carrier protein
MELQDFINNFAQQFEMTEPEEITATTVYRDLEEWDSLLSLSIIGMINNTYQVKVSGEEVKDQCTVEDLFNLVVSKKA